MKLKKILGWVLLAALLSLASCSWLQDEYFFTYSTDPGLRSASGPHQVLPPNRP